MGEREHLGDSEFSRGLNGNSLQQYCHKSRISGGKWFPHFSSINQCGDAWQALLLAGWAAVSQARGLSLLPNLSCLCRCNSFPVCLTANYFSRQAPSLKKTGYILESNCTEIWWEKFFLQAQLLHKIRVE